MVGTSVMKEIIVEKKNFSIPNPAKHLRWNFFSKKCVNTVMFGKFTLI